MPDYRRNFTPGGIYFFTVVLQNRESGLLVRHIGEFRRAYAEAKKFLPFETIAICVLPDHFHWLMKLPENDCNYPQRLQAVKYNFSKHLPVSMRHPNSSKTAKREASV